MYEVKVFYYKGFKFCGDNCEDFSDAYVTLEIPSAWELSHQETFDAPPSTDDLLVEALYTACDECRRLLNKEDRLIENIDESTLTATLEGRPSWSEPGARREHYSLTGFAFVDLPEHDIAALSGSAASLYDGGWVAADIEEYWKDAKPYTTDEDIIDWARADVEILFDLIGEYENGNEEEDEDED